MAIDTQTSSRITQVLLRMTDLYGPNGVLPGHGAEYEALQQELADLESQAN